MLTCSRPPAQPGSLSLISLLWRWRGCTLNTEHAPRSSGAWGVALRRLMYGVFITPDTRQLLLMLMLLLRVVLLSKFAPQSTGSSEELQLTGSRAPSHQVFELKLTAAHSWFAACTLHSWLVITQHCAV